MLCRAARAVFSTNQPRRENPSRLERYAAIKEKNTRIKQANREKRELQKAELTKQDTPTPNPTALVCQGCSTHLQSDRLDKYGYIDSKVLAQSLAHNQRMISVRAAGSDDTIRILREVEKEMNVDILDNTGGPLKNLDNLDVLLRIEQKQQQNRQEHQSITPAQYRRKELLCRRCFYLKHHNQLPDEHNNIQPILDQTDERQLLERIFSKKGDTYYLYMLDLFDLCGTFTEAVLERIFLSKMQWSILLSKFDMVNRKYFNYIAVKPHVREYVRNVLEGLKQRGVVPAQYKLEDYLQQIYFVSSENQVGLLKLKKLIDGLSCKVQLIGYPNTGKTSLLNSITSQKKPTSTVPGTSLTFEIGKYNKARIFDCPGLFNKKSLVNLITSPNAKSLLTWKQDRFAPGILTNSVIFYGGMVQAEGVRIILFGNGGAKAIDANSATKWLLQNYDEFWKGLPQLPLLNIVKHELTVRLVDGVGPDIEIAGYGFIGLRLCRTGRYDDKQTEKKISLYLPAAVDFRLRKSLVLDNGLHDKTAIRKMFGLRRLTEHPK